MRADEAGLRLSPNTLAAVAEQAGLHTGAKGGLPATSGIQFFKRSLLPSATLNSIWRCALTGLWELSVIFAFELDTGWTADQCCIGNGSRSSGAPAANAPDTMLSETQFNTILQVRWPLCAKRM